MKYLAIAAISLLASVQFCRADLLEGFIGTWTHNGMGSGTEITTVFRRFQTKGLVATTTYIVPGMATSVGVTRYYDNGKITGGLRRDGTVQSKHSGTWSITGTSLKAKMKVTARLYPTFSENLKSTSISNNRIRTLTASSNGARSSGTMTRRK